MAVERMSGVRSSRKPRAATPTCRDSAHLERIAKTLQTGKAVPAPRRKCIKQHVDHGPGRSDRNSPVRATLPARGLAAVAGASGPVVAERTGMRKLLLAAVTLGLVIPLGQMGGYLGGNVGGNVGGNRLLAQDGPVPPPWAYPMTPRSAPGEPAPTPDQTEQHTVPDSDKALTMAQIRSPFDIADWHPEGHPPMPEVVSKGRRPEVRACGYCHYPNGKGRPENAGIAGLPAAYIIQ